MTVKTTNKLSLRVLCFQWLAALSMGIPALHAQTFLQESRLIQEDTISQYRPDKNFSKVFIPSDFAQHKVIPQSTLDSLVNCTVYKIDLVYTLYKTVASFDQHKLNSDRWEVLHQQCPYLFDNNATMYTNWCQSGATTSEEAKRYKHGFYVYYRKNEDSITRSGELTALSDLITELETNSIRKPEDKKETKASTLIIPLYTTVPDKRTTAIPRKKAKDPTSCRCAFYGTKTFTLSDYLNAQAEKNTGFKKSEHCKARIVVGSYGHLLQLQIKESSSKKFKGFVSGCIFRMGPWNAAFSKNKFYKSELEIDIYYTKKDGFSFSQSTISPKAILSCGIIDDDSLFGVPVVPPQCESKIMTEFGDPTVYNVLKRLDNLKNTMMVIDITGSMYPHIKTVINILNDSLISAKTNLKSVVVFNDGDRKNDKHKLAGKTGGIYYTENVEQIELAKFILNAMSKGGGGDCPENNIEATLSGLEKCKDCNDVVMIADNYATPRDSKFVEKIDRPIHWILCGYGHHINTHYLDLIRENKGYGHTQLSDFSGLEFLKEGESIEIDGFIYTLKNNKFKAKEIKERS